MTALDAVVERLYSPKLGDYVARRLTMIRRRHIMQAVLEDILGRPPSGRFDGVTRILGRTKR